MRAASTLHLEGGLALLLASLWLVMGATSCKRDAEGERSTDVSGLRILYLSGNFDVMQTNDSSRTLRIIGPQNALSDIRITHHDDSVSVVDLGARRLFRSRNPRFKIFVGVVPSKHTRLTGGGSYLASWEKPVLRYVLKVNGYAGRIDANIKTRYFGMDLEECYGDVRLRGTALGGFMKTGGGHTLHAGDFSMRWLKIYLNSRSGVWVRAWEQLHVVYWLDGELHYYGDPKRLIIDKSISTGRIARAGD